MTLDPQQLFSALLDSGVHDLSGVPCSILSHLILAAEQTDDVDYLPASVEGEAVSAAAGAWLAGGLGAALMQNSGLGNAVNPLASLAIPYEIPLLMIVSWRGEPGKKDAVHHYPMGEATPGLFELLGIPVTILREDSDIKACVADAVAYMKSEERPAALVVPRGLFASNKDESKRTEPVLSRRSPLGETTEATRFRGGRLPSRSEALAAYLARWPNEAAVSTTGYMSREVGSLGTADRHFPMQGSMGFAPAIALGIARRLSEKPVFVLDGDGALIMRLGSLATIGAMAPRNFGHIVVDNGTYASTGGQLSVSPTVDFAGTALGCGYAHAASCEGLEALEEGMNWLANAMGDGPCLLHVAVDEHEAEGLSRPDLAPPEIARAFRAGLVGPVR